jgi:hypothetical protein
MLNLSSSVRDPKRISQDIAAVARDMGAPHTLMN